MKHLITLAIAASAFLASSVSAAELVDDPAQFDYLAADYIYVVTDDEAIAYAGAPMFWELKSLLLNALDRDPMAEPMESGQTFPLYVVSGSEYVTLEVNGRTLNDGSNVGYMTPEAYERFISLVDGRQGDGFDPAMLESILRRD